LELQVKKVVTKEAVIDVVCIPESKVLAVVVTIVDPTVLMAVTVMV
jgi:hypothetical protein